MIFSLIVAYSTNRVIGKDNKLLWHLAEDMKFFKEMTEGKTVIMGKKTYLSLPPRFRPLPNRLNIVLSRSEIEDEIDNLIYSSSVSSLESYLKEHKIQNAFVIGGGEIYSQMLEKADIIYATEVDLMIDGDTFFPNIDTNIWSAEVLKEVEKDEKNDFNFKIIKYSKK